jgi:hypothetical protein
MIANLSHITKGGPFAQGDQLAAQVVASGRFTAGDIFFIKLIDINRDGDPSRDFLISYLVDFIKYFSYFIDPYRIQWPRTE